ncbi:hypothetical protein [Acetobacterium sp.]|uniref:hypothetical protein n=1 Tax=Acetobacterium sp. TaxID=1872094 RepID=UPI0027207118|nr:hypothetical protein [Acetobacterium sp.]MDO9493337.1 hypothetical protein [Acetobacterium sp.]
MKIYKYSIAVALIITIVSCLISIALNNGTLAICFEQTKTLIESNIDSYNSILFGIFTSALLTFIMSIIGYNVEKNRLIRSIWINSKKLYQDFYLLIFKNISNDSLEETDFVKIIAQTGFNEKVQEWNSFYLLSLVTANNELDFIFRRSDLAKMVKNIQKDIAQLSRIMESFMNIYVNEEVGAQCVRVDIEKLFRIIKKQDEGLFIDSIKKHLDDLFELFKAEVVDAF